MLSASKGTSLTIVPISAQNEQDVLSLKLSQEQQHFIEPVQDCLEEAKKLPLWRPVGIYHHKKPIGFAMYGQFSENGTTRVWLDRFLIDHDRQGKGFGKLALALLIQRLREEYACHKIYLSLYLENKTALNLYQNFGFKCIPEKDINGEQVMTLSC